MVPTPRLLQRSLLLFLACPGVLLQGCSTSEAATPNAPRDAELAPHRVELLELAQAAASRLPLVPHVKNRARTLEAVVSACFELDQPARALRCIEAITNWRRGAGYADYALYCVEHGSGGLAEPYLERARQVVEAPDVTEEQGWRTERVRAKVAHVQALREAGPVLATAKPTEAEYAALEAAFESAEFDTLRAALEACADLYARDYADAGQRGRIVELARAGGRALPVDLRIDVLLRFADAALEHADQAGVRVHLDAARALLDGADWTAELRVPLLARLAVRRHRAGEAALARLTVAEALGVFEAELERVPDVFRAETLIPLAEAHCTLGDPPAALAIYERALEEGTRNPNARPRAEALVALCCSMARTGVEPTRVLAQELRAALEALAAPW